MGNVFKQVLCVGFAVLLTACGGGAATQPAAPVTMASASPAAEGGKAALPPIAGLSGHLIYTSGQSGELHAQDLATNQETTLYKPPQGGRVVSAAISPDKKTIVMAYAPPPPDGAVQFGYTDLVTMPADGSAQPALLLQGSDRQEVYSWPTWSADGAALYFSHAAHPDPQDPAVTTIRVERMSYPGGQPEVVAEQALWPRLSADGSQLAYLSRAEQVDSLVITDSDGSNPRLPMPKDRFPAVDAPLFSPDGKEILFSAVDAIMYHPNWLVSFLGLQVASAHDVPSDLWKVPVGGGAPTRLTKFSDYGFYPAFSPDGSHLAFIRGSGIYVMDIDGKNIARLHEPGPAGTLDWLP